MSNSVAVLMSASPSCAFLSQALPRLTQSTFFWSSRPSPIREPSTSPNGTAALSTGPVTTQSVTGSGRPVQAPIFCSPTSPRPARGNQSTSTTHPSSSRLPRSNFTIGPALVLSISTSTVPGYLYTVVGVRLPSPPSRLTRGRSSKWV